jgi:hypothetical protein
MKNVLKYICFLVAVLCFYYQNNLKSFIVNTFISKNATKETDDLLKLHLTSDNIMIALSNKVKFEINEISHNPLLDKKKLLGLELRLLYEYVQLLSFMASDNYKDNPYIKEKLKSICLWYLVYNKHFYGFINKTCDEIEKENKVIYVQEKDIKLIKKGNIYVISLFDKIINILIELEKVINNVESKGGDVRAERSFLKNLNGQK